MKSDEQFTHLGTRPHQGRGGNELFYFEGVGSGLSLRFTRLAVALVVIFTVIPVSALFILLGFNIEVQQVMVCRIPDAESRSPASCAGGCSTAAALASPLHR